MGELVAAGRSHNRDVQVSSAASVALAEHESDVSFRRTEQARSMNPQDGSPNSQSSADLTKFVQNLLNQMQTRFNTMSDSIIGRIDEMGTRIDELEKSIGELIQQAGVEDDKQPSKSIEQAGAAAHRGRCRRCPLLLLLLLLL